MPLATADPCRLSREWRISLELSERLVSMATTFEGTGHGLQIISGYRTCEEQQLLGERGRPAAPCDVSTHVSCPATGADLRVSGFATRQLKLELGRAAQLAGLRWGGGSEIQDGIPLDWNHVDLGPRR